MPIKQRLITKAVLSTIFFTTATAQAASVTSMTIADVGSGIGVYSPTLDGFAGAFRFANIDDSTYLGASFFNGDVAALPGPALGEIDTSVANGVDTFTTGFLFAGAPFKPETLGPIVADISLISGSPAMTISSLPWAGVYGSTLFSLAPQSSAPSDCVYTVSNSYEPLTVQWVNQIDASHFAYKLGWSHCITASDDPTGAFTGFNAHWRIEGVATTAVPLPAAAWLLGSGLLGLFGFARWRSTPVL